jgi:hypothetical protein
LKRLHFGNAMKFVICFSYNSKPVYHTPIILKLKIYIKLIITHVFTLLSCCYK